MKKLCCFEILLLAVALSLSGCSQKSEFSTSETYCMSTCITQQVYGPHRDEAIQNVNRLLKKEEKKLSLFQNNSFISQINCQAGIAPVKVDTDTYALIAKAKAYCAESNGKFDITVAPLTLLWGIDTSSPKVPTQAERKAAVSLIDYRKIQLSEKDHTVFLTQKGMKLDLGGIAKGYFAGAIDKEYQKLSIPAALVSIGGNICTYGKKPDGKTYVIGIRNPNSSSDADIMGKLKVGDTVISTSGAYERFFVKDGKTYHHIMDTKTGAPADTDLLSATVISSDGGLADYLSTTVFIEGTKGLPAFIHRTDCKIIAIDRNNRVYCSKSLQNSFEITDKSFSFAGDTK